MNNKIFTLKKYYSGKVRDLYEIDEKLLLMVASDRMSTFDIILPDLFSNKGVYLTEISLFWFKFLEPYINNHIVNNFNLGAYLHSFELEYIKDRNIVIRKTKPVLIECIVRGYLCGSAYKEYSQSQSVCGIPLPNGLSKNDKLPEPIFTPSTKSNIGQHDINITHNECRNFIGVDLFNKLKELSLILYNVANDYASKSGIIIADTKFEFGIYNNELILIDEVLTPDSSRIWHKEKYDNKIYFNLDKQFLRNYLELELKWNKQPPLPHLSADIIKATTDRYFEVIKLLNINYK